GHIGIGADDDVVPPIKGKHGYRHLTPILCRIMCREKVEPAAIVDHTRFDERLEVADLGLLVGRHRLILETQISLRSRPVSSDHLVEAPRPSLTCGRALRL